MVGGTAPHTALRLGEARGTASTANTAGTGHRLLRTAYWAVTALRHAGVVLVDAKPPPVSTGDGAVASRPPGPVGSPRHRRRPVGPELRLVPGRGSTVPSSTVPPGPTSAGNLVAALRGKPDQRPPIDRALAGGLREWLQDDLATVAAGRPADGTPLVVGRPSAVAGGTVGTPWLRAVLVGILFRQWVLTGTVGDPVADSYAGLVAQGGGERALDQLAALLPAERAALETEVRAQARTIVRQWAALSPSWHPRTRERLAVPLAGQRILLGGVVDLLLGAAPVDRASVCLVSVRSGEPRPDDADDRRFLAMLETIRSRAQPFRVATYYPQAGQAEIEEVTDSLLAGAVQRTVERVARLAALDDAAA